MTNFSNIPPVVDVLIPPHRNVLDLVLALTCASGFLILFFGYRYSTATPLPIAGTSKQSLKKARRMEYVFTEKDVADAQQNVDRGLVTVSKILVHPIKSCRGTSVQEARFTPAGLEHDRAWCIIDAKTHKILTARQIPKMVLITPKVIEDPADSSKGTLEVSFPADSGCETFSIPLRPTQEMLEQWHIVDDATVFSWTELDGYITQPSDIDLPQELPSEVLSKYMERPVHLIYKGPRVRATRPTLNFPDISVPFKFQDGYPLLIASEESFEGVRGMTELWRKEQGPVDEVVEKHIDALVLERFRPNIVFRGAGKPFAEDMWQKITIGSVDLPESASGFDVVSKCTRCMLPNVDPKTGERNMAVPSKPLAEFRKGLDPAREGDSCFGCNAIPTDSGVVHVGDAVSVKQWAHV